MSFNLIETEADRISSGGEIPDGETLLCLYFSAIMSAFYGGSDDAIDEFFCQHAGRPHEEIAAALAILAAASVAALKPDRVVV